MIVEGLFLGSSVYFWWKTNKNIKELSNKSQSIEEQTQVVSKELTEYYTHSNNLIDLLSDSYNKALLTEGQGSKIIQEVENKNKKLLEKIDAKLYLTQPKIPPAKLIYGAILSDDLEVWSSVIKELKKNYSGTLNVNTIAKRKALLEIDRYCGVLQKIAAAAESFVKEESPETVLNLKNIINEIEFPK